MLYALCLYLFITARCLMLTDSGFLEPIVEYGPGTAHPWSHGYSFHRTVHGTSPTLHATVSVQNFYNSTIEHKYRVTAHMGAQTATCTLVTVQLKRDNIFQITKVLKWPHPTQLIR
jgi:hypothetical protein